MKLFIIIIIIIITKCVLYLVEDGVDKALFKSVEDKQRNKTNERSVGHQQPRLVAYSLQHVLGLMWTFFWFALLFSRYVFANLLIISIIIIITREMFNLD